MLSSTHHALRCTALQVLLLLLLLLLRRRRACADVVSNVSGNLQWDRIIPKSFVDYWRRLEQQVFLPFSCRLLEHALSACSSPSPPAATVFGAVIYPHPTGRNRSSARRTGHRFAKITEKSLMFQAQRIQIEKMRLDQEQVSPSHSTFKASNF
jgi:hypothetical protein